LFSLHYFRNDEIAPSSKPYKDPFVRETGDESDHALCCQGAAGASRGLSPRRPQRSPYAGAKNERLFFSIIAALSGRGFLKPKDASIR
jgi:hypothetical protein